MHPRCTYDGTASKCEKNGSADRDHQFLLKAQVQRDAIVHDLASVDLPSAQHIDRSGNRGARRAVNRPACPHLAPAIPVRFSSNARNTRLVAIGTITILLIVGYISLLRYFHVSEMPVERDLGLKSAVGPTPQIYIEPISIDALNDAMQMRVSFAPSGTLYGERLAPTERRLRLVITHDRAVEEIRVAPNDRPPTTTSEVDLSGGSVADYPLDSYRADLRVQLFEEQFLPLTKQSRWLPR